MKRPIGLGVAAALFLSALPGLAMAQQAASQLPTIRGPNGQLLDVPPTVAVPFKPNAAGSASLSTSASSANVALPALTDPVAEVTNTGAVAEYVALGGAGVTATTSGTLIPVGCTIALTIQAGQTNLAGITASGSSALSVAVGQGSGYSLCPGSSGGGGGGGPVTAAAGSYAAGALVDLGTTADAACATDNGACGLIALSKRGNQRLTSVLTALGSPFQAGGSIGNTAFGATQSGTWTMQPGNTPNTTPWLVTPSATGVNVTDTPTIQTASYVSGNCMGGFQTVALGAGQTVLSQIALVSKGGLITAKTVYVFSANPTSSTCTDKSTFTLNAADVSKLMTVVSITPAVPTGTTSSYGAASNLGLGIPSGGTVYLGIVETATETPASTSDLVLPISTF